MERLSEAHWGTVMDVVDQWVRESGLGLDAALPWCVEKLRTEWGMGADDCAAVLPRYKRWRMDRWREDEFGDAPLDDRRAAAAAKACRLTMGQMAAVAEMVEEMFGVELAEIVPVWVDGPKITLYDGDTVETLQGKGRDWMVSAVQVRRAGGEVKIYPEAKVGYVDRSPAPGRRGRRAGLKVLTMECRGLNVEGMMRRAAAWKLAYFGPESGVADAVELAELCGIRKQSVNGRMKKVRTWHKARSGGALFGEVPARGRREGTRGTEGTEAGGERGEQKGAKEAKAGGEMGGTGGCGGVKPRDAA